MPIYNYKCLRCKQVLEVTRPMADRDKQYDCNKEGCEGVCERTVETPAPAQFKGRGWTPKKLERR